MRTGIICQHDVHVRREIHVAESGGEEQATGAHADTLDVFMSYASSNSAVAEAACEAMERDRHYVLDRPPGM